MIPIDEPSPGHHPEPSAQLPDYPSSAEARQRRVASRCHSRPVGMMVPRGLLVRVCCPFLMVGPSSIDSSPCKPIHSIGGCDNVASLKKLPSLLVSIKEALVSHETTRCDCLIAG